jgi:hypothetical protein
MEIGPMAKTMNPFVQGFLSEIGKDATSVGGILKAVGAKSTGRKGQNITHAEMLSRDIPTGTIAHKDMLNKLRSASAAKARPE